MLEERARLARDLHDAVSRRSCSACGPRPRAAARAGGARPGQGRGRDPQRRGAGRRRRTPSCGPSSTASPRRTWPPAAWPGRCAATPCSAGRTLRARRPGRRRRAAASWTPRGRRRCTGSRRRRCTTRCGTPAPPRSGSACARPRRVALEVADRGRGFDLASPASGLGLASMRERAAAVGGSLAIRSGPGQGTTVRLTVPRAAQRPPPDRQPGDAAGVMTGADQRADRR